MRVDVFSSKPHDRSFLSLAAKGQVLELHFHEARLNTGTARLAEGAAAVCASLSRVQARAGDEAP